MRIVVTGGRDFTDAVVINRALDAVHAKHVITELVHGDCPTGADKLSDLWAISKGVKVRKFPADWRKLGRRAGPIRNQQMIDEGKPDAAVAFPGGDGTADMVIRCKTAKLPMWKVKPR